jgi:hypothetical protein
MHMGLGWHSVCLGPILVSSFDIYNVLDLFQRITISRTSHNPTVIELEVILSELEQGTFLAEST